ncbi:MAG: NifB/NifX family molybdenum-iron cluster-binding protein [Anaerolineales bacterium]
MRIAVSAEQNQGLESVAAHHFGRCPYYIIVDVDDHHITAVESIANPYYQAHRPGQVPAFIREQGVDMMVAGGMGRRAIALFQQYGIEAYTGAAGVVRRALEQALGGQLEEAAPCGHDDHDEHGKQAAREAHEAHDEASGEIRRLREEVDALRQQIAEAAAALDELT